MSDRENASCMVDPELETDPISLENETLLEAVLDGIRHAREEYSQNHNVLKACDILEREARQGVPLNKLCETRRDLAKLLPTEEREVHNIMLQAIAHIRSVTAELRDPCKPLLPHRIITHETHRYNGEPWYLASFDYHDERSGTTGGPHLAFIRTPEHIVKPGEPLPRTTFRDKNHFGNKPVLMRIHSQCLLGDIAVGQARCDCGQQFREAMDTINDEKSGILLYLFQEGRGVGLREKLELLELAEGRHEGKPIDKILDTETAMLLHGHSKAEFRDFRFAGQILRGLGVENIMLITNNPRKISALQKLGFTVDTTDATGVAVTAENLMEFLWKITQSHTIRYESLPKIAIQIDTLKNGGRINDALYDRLCELWHLVETQARHTVPDGLVDLLKSVKDRLR